MENITLKLKADEVRRIRQQKGLSQENMAGELGLSQSQYSRIEQGDCAVSYEKVFEISQILDVTPEEIIETGKNFIFHNCNCSQAGNIEKNTINNNQDFTEERKAYLEQIKFLQEQNAELLKMVQSKN